MFYRGWLLVAVGFLVYGIGLAPAYYSWGFLAPELRGDLGLTREQVGNTFGLFTLVFALTSPIAAAVLTRWGIRIVVTAGSLLAAVGFALTGTAESAHELLVAYSLIGGVGVGLSTLLPAHVLPVFWFRRYRARATALILLGAAVVGGLVPAVDDWLLRSHDWRFVWRCIAGASLLVALLAVACLRNRPEDVGLLADGDPEGGRDEDGQAEPAPSLQATSEALEPATLEAIRSPQFLIVTFACLANTVPWRVFTAHGRLHFEDLGFASAVAAAILGVRVAVSAFGRLSGSLCDFIAPARVLALSLGITAIGMLGVASTTSTSAAYLWIVFLGFGYGAAFTSEPLVLSSVLGARAFVGSNGLRIAITGVVGWLGPRWAGAAADRTESYSDTFLALAALAVAGAMALLLVRSPRGRSEARTPGTGS